MTYLNYQKFLRMSLLSFKVLEKKGNKCYTSVYITQPTKEKHSYKTTGNETVFETSILYFLASYKIEISQVH